MHLACQSLLHIDELRLRQNDHERKTGRHMGKIVIDWKQKRRGPGQYYIPF